MLLQSEECNFIWHRMWMDSVWRVLTLTSRYGQYLLTGVGDRIKNPTSYPEISPRKDKRLNVVNHTIITHYLRAGTDLDTDTVSRCHGNRRSPVEIMGPKLHGLSITITLRKECCLSSLYLCCGHSCTPQQRLGDHIFSKVWNHYICCYWLKMELHRKHRAFVFFPQVWGKDRWGFTGLKQTHFHDFMFLCILGCFTWLLGGNKSRCLAVFCICLKSNYPNWRSSCIQ